MSSITVPTSQNGWTVKDDNGSVIGVITASALGFVAWSAAGRSLGGYTSMAAAVAAIESVTGK